MHELFPLKDKKSIIITNAFQKILDESSSKSNKICVRKGSKIYTRSMKSWFQDNDIVMHSTENEGKPVVAERFTRTLKEQILQTYDFNIKTSVYIDKLANIVNKYYNTYHRTIKMKLFGVKSSTYIHFS